MGKVNKKILLLSMLILLFISISSAYASEDFSIDDANDVTIVSENREETVVDGDSSIDADSNEANLKKVSRLESSDSDSSILGSIGYGPEGSQGTYDHYTSTYANKTFNGFTQMCNDCIFLDCNFVNATLDMQEFYYHEWLGAPENMWDVKGSYVCNFTNCNFINTSLDEGSLAYSKRYCLVNFINCTFENITADSIVKQVGGFTLQDAINFYACSFNNVNVKGIVDVPTRANPFERYVVEDCTYDGALADNFDVLPENNRDYINATYRAGSVLTIDIDEDGNLVINLKDSEDNTLPNEEILVSLNGESTPYELDENGTLLIDLTDFRGELNITASFEGSDDYKSAFSSMDIYLVVKTVTEVINNTVTEYVNKTLESTNIVASDLTATAKVAKTLSLTLKDANGKAIANKAIAYSINGITKTVTTDANGIAKIDVNQANAGSYYYYLCFLGDNDYKASFKSVKVAVNKQATKAVFKAKTFKVKAKSKKVSFTLKDASGKAIKGKKITFKINKNTYTAKTNAKGIATVKVKLTKKGKYTATAKFAGDSTYKAISKKAKITIK
jgi:uncharacterized protein YjbI with pentapeptide repeats